MKLVMFAVGDMPWRAGLWQGEYVTDLYTPDLFLGMNVVNAAGGMALNGRIYDLSEVRLGPPIPVPPSFRDFMGYEDHVKNSAANRGEGVTPEWYQIPVFYFSNPAAIYGPEDVIPYPRGCQALDAEFEWAAVIGKSGRNIRAEDAHEYIAGFMLLNDWSARDFQALEMKVRLGPAKGKDFATSIGPCLITPDELADRYSDGRYSLECTWRINGQEKMRSNTNTQYWTFAQCIERASQNVTLKPGDIIGSGTIGNGCLLEEGAKRERWLQPGDVVELEIERLGILRNTIGEPEE